MTFNEWWARNEGQAFIGEDDRLLSEEAWSTAQRETAKQSASEIEALKAEVRRLTKEKEASLSVRVAYFIKRLEETKDQRDQQCHNELLQRLTARDLDTIEHLQQGQRLITLEGGTVGWGYSINENGKLVDVFGDVWRQHLTVAG